MNRKTTLAAALSLALVAMAGATAAKAELKDETEIQESLIVIGIAYEIGEKCPSVSARLFRGLSALRAVETRASAMGYSDAEVDAYVEDKVEKARLVGIAKERLRGMGAVTGQADTYCAVGRAEIAAGSEIGQLLR